jgi:hypothetical protein
MRMNSSEPIRWGGLAAMLGGMLYVAMFGVRVLIYGVFAGETKDTFLRAHAFIHSLGVPMFALLALGTVAVYARQKDRFERVAKAGFYTTLAGFGLWVVGGSRSSRSALR